MAATKTSNSRESSTTRPPVPLTTFFTPPATCLDVVTYDGTSFWQNGLAQTGDAGCYPSGFSKIYNSWFTPGICPESWTSVGTDPSHPSTVSDAMCCPSSYFLHTTNGGTLANVCASLISTDLTNVWSRTSREPGPMPNSHPLTTIKKADITSNTVWADVIQVRWKSDNPKILSLLAQQTASSKSSSSPMTGSASASPASSIAKSSTTPTHRHRDNGGLSSGAEAGIGIGVALCAAALAVAVFLFFRHRRRKNKAAQRTAASAEEGKKPPGYSEMEQHDAGHLPPVELDGGNVNELAGSEARAELEHK